MMATPHLKCENGHCLMSFCKKIHKIKQKYWYFVIKSHLKVLMIFCQKEDPTDIIGCYWNGRFYIRVSLPSLPVLYQSVLSPKLVINQSSGIPHGSSRIDGRWCYKRIHHASYFSSWCLLRQPLHQVNLMEGLV